MNVIHDVGRILSLVLVHLKCSDTDVTPLTSVELLFDFRHCDLKVSGLLTKKAFWYWIRYLKNITKEGKRRIVLFHLAKSTTHSAEEWAWLPRMTSVYFINRRAASWWLSVIVQFLTSCKGRLLTLAYATTYLAHSGLLLSGLLCMETERFWKVTY